MDDVRPTVHTRPRGNAVRATSTFTELAQAVRERGLLHRRYGYYWTKLIAAPIAVGVCLLAFVWIGDTWWQLFTAAALAIVFTQIAFLGHDAAHRQIFVSGRWNDWISIILGDLLVGMSYGWWQHKHTRHHANPNKLGTDPDIELPVIAVSPRLRRDTGDRSSRGCADTRACCSSRSCFSRALLHASSVRRMFVRGRLDRRWAEIVFLSVRMIGYLVLVFIVLSPAPPSCSSRCSWACSGSTWGSPSPPTTRACRWCPAT